LTNHLDDESPLGPPIGSARRFDPNLNIQIHDFERIFLDEFSTAFDIFAHQR
jgi:hypothetical protein